MKFYEFRQNNSGGHFHEDEASGIGPSVIVEASSAEEANEKAQSLGIYFDGVDDDTDCDCCGDRWYPVDEDDGKYVPSHYGDFVEDVVADWYNTGSYVHRLNGEIQYFKYKEKPDGK
jgi:hypothetical protein